MLDNAIQSGNEEKREISFNWPFSSQFVQQESLAFLSLHVALLVLGARETNLQNREFALVVGLRASVSRFALWGPFLEGSRKGFAPRKPWQHLKPYDFRAVVFTYSLRTEVSCVQEVSGVYTSLFFVPDQLKMAFRARKGSGAFEKWAPGPLIRLFCRLQKTRD